jgi:hypothetical protein
MNCCKNNKQEEKNLPTESGDQQNNHDDNDAKASKHSHKNHFLHLALCCGLPLLLLFVLPLIGYQGILLSIAPFICPIMMFVMMPMMMKRQDRKEK